MKHCLFLVAAIALGASVCRADTIVGTTTAATGIDGLVLTGYPYGSPIPGGVTFDVSFQTGGAPASNIFGYYDLFTAADAIDASLNAHGVLGIAGDVPSDALGEGPYTETYFIQGGGGSLGVLGYNGNPPAAATDGGWTFGYNVSSGDLSNYYTGTTYAVFTQVGVPEPSSVILFGLGATTLFISARRRMALVAQRARKQWPRVPNGTNLEKEEHSATG